MKLFNKLTGIFALGALLFSCSDSDCDCGPNELGVPISLSSRVTFEQRIQDTRIVEGQSLSFFVTLNESTSDVLYNNYRITADGADGFTYQSTMYYPVNGDDVDFYAIHPYTEGANLTQALGFTVSPNQSNSEGYLSSDLLWATNEGVSRTTSKVGMTFRHMLSKIDIVVRQGVGGVDLQELQSIQILNLQPTTTITPSTGALGTATGSAAPISPYGIPVTIADGVIQVDGITAIVVPQQLTAGQALLSVRIGDATFTYVPSTNFEFFSGQRHKLTVTLNATGIDLTSEITPWTDGGSLEGEGTLD